MSRTRQNKGKWKEPYTRGRTVPRGGKHGRLGSDGKYHTEGPQDDALWSQGIGKTMATKDD